MKKASGWFTNAKLRELRVKWSNRILNSGDRSIKTKEYKSIK